MVPIVVAPKIREDIELSQRMARGHPGVITCKTRALPTETEVIWYKGDKTLDDEVTDKSSATVPFNATHEDLLCEMRQIYLYPAHFFSDILII